ncbi:MAG: GWxTD domain-containing protein [Gemmatimonadota bacterium]
MISTALRRQLALPPAGVVMVRWINLSLGIALIAGPAYAQSPAERRMLDTLRDSLAGTSDTAALTLKVTAAERLQHASRDPIAQLAFAFAEVRLGEVLSQRTPIDRAADAFARVADQRPDWPYPWFGLGAAKLSLWDGGYIALPRSHQPPGADYLYTAFQAFNRASNLDHTFAAPAMGLAEVARRDRGSPHFTLIAGQLRQAAESSSNTLLLLALARASRASGEIDQSLEALDRYLANGGDSAVAGFERARTLYAGRRPRDAEAAYYEGAEHLERPESVGLYRSDIVWIATPEELAGFDSLRHAEYREWLHRFWQKRDVADAREPGDRLAEHARRYTYALRNYRRPNFVRTYGREFPYRNPQDSLDDRGVIYLRHGEPNRSITTLDSDGAFFCRNITWKYGNDGDGMLFNFRTGAFKFCQFADYKLIPSVTDMYGGSFGDRGGIDPIYQQLALFPNSRKVLQQERDWGARSIEIGTTTDSYKYRFERPMPAIVSVYAVGQLASDEAGVLLVYGASGTGLAPTREQGDSVQRYRLGIRVVVSTLSDSVVLRTDTAQQLRTARKLGKNGSLVGYFHLPLLPGDYAVRLVLRDSANQSGTVLENGKVTVPDFSSPALVLSDLILGRDSTSLRWTRGGQAVALNPLGGFPRAVPMDIYYEAGGMTSGTRYRTQVAISDEGDGRNRIAVGFEEDATARIQQMRRTLRLDTLRPGRYVLSVTLQAANGGPAVRRTARITVE